ncbi:MAG: site-2 protease family protein [Bacillota bacterium]|nr:site-2 protease family protein [Bacillota bacterium]
MRRSNLNISMIVIIAVLLFSSMRSGGFSDPIQWLSEKLIILPGIIIGLSMHEFAHAAVAYKLGDNTPKLQGRVTINPLAHIDWIGLAALFFCGFGWGQPVQINPFNFKNRRRDELFVALAGVVMNLLLAILFTFVLKAVTAAFGSYTLASGMGQIVWYIIYYTIQINLVLMVFNLIPIPPLDGFNIIAEIFNFGQTETYWKIYQYGNWILVALIIFGVAGMIIAPCVNGLMNIVWAMI